MKFHTDRAPARTWPVARRGATSPADAKLLHKTNPANVLIGAWRIDGGRAESTPLAPPPDHLLAKGDAHHYSPHYVLETTRQFITGLVHSVYGVPLGMPMNLVGVELSLDAPLPRGASLKLLHELIPLAAPGSSTFTHWDVQLVASDEVLGSCRLTGQLLSAEEYLRARYGRNAAAA
jgi:hypothetical protein